MGKNREFLELWQKGKTNAEGKELYSGIVGRGKEQSYLVEV
jgi:hypothetical protein